MGYDPNIHHRRSIRLKEYDYLRNGAYYITICTNNRECLFDNDPVKQMIYKWWNELPHKFSNVELDEFVIMPNHAHAILFLVGADLCVCPDDGGDQKIRLKGEHTDSPLHEIVQWFKTMTTNEYIRNVKQYGWKPFYKKLWQRDYFERIIRNDEELNIKRNYIKNNLIKWEFDENNLKNWSDQNNRLNGEHTGSPLQNN